MGITSSTSCPVVPAEITEDIWMRLSVLEAGEVQSVGLYLFTSCSRSTFMETAAFSRFPIIGECRRAHR